MQKYESLYKAKPKMARRPPARAGVAYWAMAAAPELAAGLAPVEPEAAAPPLRVGEVPEEPDAPLDLALADFVVMLPHWEFLADSHWNWAALFWLVALMQAPNQKRHICPGTVCS